MAEGYRVAVVGATGMVGQAMRSILDAAISRMERREEAPRGPRRVEVKQEGEARG